MSNVQCPKSKIEGRTLDFGLGTLDLSECPNVQSQKIEGRTLDFGPWTLDYSSGSSGIVTCIPRVDGKQLITWTRSMRFSSDSGACQSFTQKVRVGP